MTPAQNKLYWREWAAVRRAQPDADRHGITAKALGHGKSHLDFTNRDFDLVLGAFRAIHNPDLNGQLRQDGGDTRRVMHRISETQELLGVYVEDVAGYVVTVLADKFGVPAGGSKTLDDLSDKPRVFRNRTTGQLVELPSQLMQLQMTLWDRLKALRRKAGHSMHDMYVKTSVECPCAKCRRLRLAGSAAGTHPIPENAEMGPAMAGDSDDNNPF